MNIIGDYHTHTVYSHGTGTIRENVEAALNKGLKEIAICDHGPGHFLYGVKRKEIFKMRKEIDELKEEYKEKGINVLLGVEANVMDYDGNIDVDEEIIEILDILLLGFHYGIVPKNIKSIFLFYILNPTSKVISIFENKMKQSNTEAVIKAMKKYPIDIITHPGSKAKLDIRKLSDVAYNEGTALEINSHHSQLSVENLEIALKSKVEFYINSDAHSPSDVGNVEEGIKRILQANIPINRIINAKD